MEPALGALSLGPQILAVRRRTAYWRLEQLHGHVCYNGKAQQLPT